MFFKEKIKWIWLCDSYDVLKKRIDVGEIVVYNVDRKKVAIARTAEGFHAVKDRCPHQGSTFYGGYCTKDNKIVCPRHRYEFDLKTGRGHGDYVDVYPLEEREDGIYIGFSYLGLGWFS